MFLFADFLKGEDYQFVMYTFLYLFAYNYSKN